jgi:outer membrane lipoprotein-sorting protein
MEFNMIISDKNPSASRSSQNINLVACVILILLSLATVYSASLPILDQIRAKYTAKTTVDADFNVSIYWKVREKTETKSGHLCFAPGDKFKAELDNTTWVSNGQTFWQYSSANNQVIIKNLIDVDLSSHPSQILSTYLTKYTYKIKEENEKQAVLIWTADSAAAKNFYQSITLWAEKADASVTKLVVIDRQGNESTYQFKKVKFGIAIPPNTFEFEVPKDASILDTRN